MPGRGGICSRFSPSFPVQHAAGEDLTPGGSPATDSGSSLGDSAQLERRTGELDSGGERLEGGLGEDLFERDCPVGNLVIGAYNCEGFLSAVPYIMTLLQSCHVLFLAETWLSLSEQSIMTHVMHGGGNDLLCIQSHAMELPPGVGEGRRHGGVALICKRLAGLKFSEISCEDSRLCGVTVSNDHGPIASILGCYMPFWDGSANTYVNFADIIGKLDALIAALRPSSPVALIGDFNCALPRMPAPSRPTNWTQLRGFSPLSYQMQSLLDDNGLLVAEFCFPQETSYTYGRGNYHTHIDHIAISRCLQGVMVSCSILPATFENLSPHLPIIAEFRIPVRSVSKSAKLVNVSIPRPDSLRWDLEERNETYKHLLSSRLSVMLGSSASAADCLDYFAESVVSSIHSAARDSGCARQSRPPKSWWTPSVSAARDRCRLWHRIWTECGRPCRGAVHDCYHETRRTYRRTRKIAARSSIDQEAKLLHTLRNRNVPSFWKHVGRARRQQQPAQCALDSEDFRIHFSDIHDDNGEQLSPSQRLVRDAVAERFSIGCNDAERRVVSVEEVAKLLPRLKRGSAPGPDSVTAEHLIFGQCSELLKAIAILFTMCFSTGRVPASFSTSVVKPMLKKSGMDPNELDNYRPISLTSVLSKLLELLVLAELESSFAPHDLQFGFVQHRGTNEASILISETVQWHLRRGSPVFAANLDARKFFDRIWHDGLFWRLIDLLSPRTWYLLLSWYRDLRGKVAFQGMLSRDFRVRRGTRQGAILSPTLANVFLLPLIASLDDSGKGAFLHGCHVPAVCYADDLCLLSCNANYLSHLLSLVDKFAEDWRLEFTCPEIAKTKSHCIVFGGDALAEAPSWFLAGQQLKIVKETEHLGSVVSATLQAKQHIAQRERRARGSFFGLTPAGIFSKELAPLDKAFLWRTIVAPSLTFGAAVVPLRPENVMQLERFQARYIKASLGLPAQAHHSALLAALRVPPVRETLRSMVARALCNAFRCEHRLSRALTRGLAVLATDPAQLDGSFLGLVYSICNSRLENVLSIASGHIEQDMIHPQSLHDGVIDSLRFLATRTDSLARHLLRLIVMPGL